MARGKRRSGVWHHRVPDFKLIYCGPDNKDSKKEHDFTSGEKCLKKSIIEEQYAKSSIMLEQEKT
jgi:hypothetical protein